MRKLTTAERLIEMEQKLDRNTNKLDRLETCQKDVEKKVDATHDAILNLPTELDKRYPTRMEFNAFKWGLGILVAALTVASILIRIGG